MKIRKLSIKSLPTIHSNTYFQRFHHIPFTTTTKHDITNTNTSSTLQDMFKLQSTKSHNIYRGSQQILSILTTMDNRCRNMESNNPVIQHDYLTPTILSKFVPDIYKPKDIKGGFNAIVSHIEPYRTLYIDQLLQNFIFTDNPNNKTKEYHIIELGIGFDFRIERILNFMQTTQQPINEINLHLYEMDLPNVLDVRNCIMNEFSGYGNFAEDHSKINIHRHSLRKSIFDRKWIENLYHDIRSKNIMENDFSNVIIVTEAFF
eukprot:100581_1